MFDFSKLFKDAQNGVSRTHIRVVGSAATVAVAATLTAGAFITDEPANAEAAAVTNSASESAVVESSTEAPAPAAVEPAAVEPAAVDPAAVEPAAVEPAPEPVVAPEPPPAPVYENNLDGWIRQSLDILASHNIPASYDGIMRNVMRESTGNPAAINLWDSNAAAGIPSKGLLQVIDPTYAAYHVEGTVYDIWDPVSNIVAACNYAAHKYGSMDNVNGAY